MDFPPGPFGAPVFCLGTNGVKAFGDPLGVVGSEVTCGLEKEQQGFAPGGNGLNSFGDGDGLVQGEFCEVRVVAVCESDNFPCATGGSLIGVDAIGGCLGGESGDGHRVGVGEAGGPCHGHGPVPRDANGVCHGEGPCGV